MPHAVDRDDDEDAIQRFLGGEQIEELGDFHNRDLDLGEKADDAEDYEDIGDDDLADEEDLAEDTVVQNGDKPIKIETDDHAGLFEAGGAEQDPFDDLFGSNDEPHSPHASTAQPSQRNDVHRPPEAGARHDRSHSSDTSGAEDASFERGQSQGDGPVMMDVDSDEDDEVREQRMLFEQARLEREQRMRRGESFGMPLPAPYSDAELFSIIWPQFEAHKPPRFGELLPGKRAQFLSKKPLKPPKPIQPTKVNLELQQDQEKSFRLPAPAATSFQTRRAEAESRGIILTADNELALESSDEDLDFDEMDTSQDGVGNVNWQDIVAVCQDWDVASDGASSVNGVFDVFDDAEGDTSRREDFERSHPAKKRKLDQSRSLPLQLMQNINALLDDPEKATARLAKRVKIDMNDPHMLIDMQDPVTVTNRKRKIGTAFSRDVAGNLTKDLGRRYNISNDEAYDLLKENHQSKIRSNLGSVAIEHALPAVKLQYPFYKVKLSNKDARSWHRPTMSFSQNLVHFAAPDRIKRKHIKGKDVASLFSKSRDLSLGDNSDMLLLEYSEEYPPMMSNFGMGSRLVNYYRRKDAEDNSRPKLELGETSVLLPQDKSPFSIFGDVDRGQIVPTIHNAMYRAPVFKHDVNPQDFIISRNSNGENKSTWYLRNMENLHVVGQEFPSVEVPGTHSRKVTDASKKRLRMLSYRMFRRHGRLRNEMILKHLPGSDIAQNRSKMREFMDYDKDRGWLPRKNETVPEEASIRSWIRPEDLCLLESMQVGDRHLRDAGYNKPEDELADDNSEEEDATQNIDKQLAPWQTTKNFLNACQGKAMLKLHGEGDPSGRGEAFNFIRTSMKGGFKALGESVEDRLDAKKQKELGGHSYNVARQQQAYNDTIRRIWEAQRRGLSSNVEHDVDMEDAVDERNTPGTSRARTPSSAVRTGRRDDDTSVVSRGSGADQSGKILRITRTSRDKYGKEDKRVELVKDPKVIREYVKRREKQRLANLSLDKLKVTGDEDYDQQQRKMIEAELARLERNRDRRFAREKAKGITSAASPGSDAGSPPAEGADSSKRRNITGSTQRKCANCGQVGHIKTNKKLCSTCIYMSTPLKDLGLCPLLNGTIQQDEGFGDSAFGSITAATPTASTAGGAGSPGGVVQ